MRKEESPEKETAVRSGENQEETVISEGLEVFISLGEDHPWCLMHGKTLKDGNRKEISY